MAFETIPMALVTTQLAARPGQGNKLVTRSGCKLLKGWSHPPGSNRRPADYESAALPTELGWLDFYLYSMKRLRHSLAIIAESRWRIRSHPRRARLLPLCPRPTDR